MPMPAHMTLEGENQGVIDGSCEMQGREDTILIEAFNHEVICAGIGMVECSFECRKNVLFPSERLARHVSAFSPGIEHRVRYSIEP